jgi:molybdopterin/thiamine biosynthesis adenylyltransferase
MLERCEADDLLHDYVLGAYAPLAPHEGKLRSVSLDTGAPADSAALAPLLAELPLEARPALEKFIAAAYAVYDDLDASLLEMNPEIEVEAIATRLEGDALRDAVARATVVLDCCDNFATRHAVNRACVEAGVPLVSGAAIRFDGQLAVFDTRRADSPCYHCLFPDGQDVEEVRCATMGVFAPLTGIVGTMQAAEALKLAGGFGTPMTGQLLLIDTRTMSIDRIRVPRDPGCPVCGHRPHV